jgi:two-component system, chemotaxis family, CheB/CheR fusion protein
MAEQQTLKDLVRELAEQKGVDLRGYKPTTLERRLRRRMQQLGITSYSDYLEYIRNTPSENNELLNTVLINVTEFFRDPQAWDYLGHEVLPVLFQSRPAGSLFKVWCAGCSSGEEAYSAAIMLSEFLGPRIRSYNIKIYATDNDEDALSIARHGEYTSESLHLVPPKIREKYFSGMGISRIVRHVRKLVIFGRSNLLIDAPISHVDLLICRNVLIYFEPMAQQHIVARLRYALNDGGILFLGKSESQLKRYSDMLPLNPKWRIFQRRTYPDQTKARDGNGKAEMDSNLKEKAQHELQNLKLYYDALLSTLEPGILVMDSSDTIITENEKVAKFFDLSGNLVGKKLQDTELWQRCPELKQHLRESRAGHPNTIRFECGTSPSCTVAVTIKPILSHSQAGQVGTLIYVENIAPRATLQGTIGDLEGTAQDLQTANEELETTNEELQSTNEELETTNEELQSTNEELETTNEELQSLNEELETTNEELSARTRELDEVNARYSEMLERMPWPVFLINEDGAIYMFNSAAQGLFGFASPSVKGMQLKELPLDGKSRQLLEERYTFVVKSHIGTELRNRRISTNRFQGKVTVHFIPLSKGSSGHGVIVMFETKIGGRPTLHAEKKKKSTQRNSPPSDSGRKGAAKKKSISKRKRRH